MMQDVAPRFSIKSMVRICGARDASRSATPPIFLSGLGEYSWIEYAVNEINHNGICKRLVRD